MPITESRGNHGAGRVEVYSIVGGTDRLANKVVATIIRTVQPATTFAVEDVRAGASTPAENFPVYAFDASTDEFLDFHCVLHPNYASGGLTIKLKWAGATATTGAVIWGAAIRRCADDAEDMDAAHTYDFNHISATTASASGEWSYDNITFTDGADMDSLTAGEYFVLRIYRDANGTNGTDDMAGDAQLSPAILICET